MHEQRAQRPVGRAGRQAGPVPGWGRQMAAGGPHPTSGLLLSSPQAQIVSVCVFKNREECAADCAQPPYSLPGPALQGCCEGRAHLASARPQASKQYKDTCNTATDVSEKTRPQGWPPHFLAAGSLSSPPLPDTKDRHLDFQVTRYLRYF